MRLVDKYILRSFLRPLFYCLFIFIFIYVLIDLFGHLDEIIKGRVGAQFILLYYLTYMPSILTQIMPIAILIATMSTLGGFVKHNELTALRASGIGLWNILKPFLVIGFFVSAFILIVNDTIVPRATRIFLKIKEEKIEKKEAASISTKTIKDVALYGTGNKIIYAKSYDPKTKTLRDVIVQEHDKWQNIVSKTLAKEARWTREGWTAFNVTSYKLDRSGGIKEEPKFEHRGVLNIKEGPNEFQNQSSKTEVLTAAELRNYIKRLSGASGLILQNLSVEAHNRAAYPFANLIAVLIGAAFCLRAKKGSRLLGIGLGLLVGLLFYGVFAISTALGKGGLLAPFISSWLANIIFGAWGIYIINRYY